MREGNKGTEVANIYNFSLCDWESAIPIQKEER